MWPAWASCGLGKPAGERPRGKPPEELLPSRRRGEGPSLRQSGDTTSRPQGEIAELWRKALSLPRWWLQLLWCLRSGDADPWGPWHWLGEQLSPFSPPRSPRQRSLLCKHQHQWGIGREGRAASVGVSRLWLSLGAALWLLPRGCRQPLG